MARVPSYVAQDSAITGPVQESASAGAFGAAQGQSAQEIGNALVDVGGLLARRRKEGEAIWVDNVATNAEIQWNKKLEDMKNTAGSGAPGFTGNVLKEWDDFQQETLKDAPTGSAERMLGSTLNNLRQRITDHATQFEAQQRVAKQIDDVEYGLNQKIALSALDPTRTMELMNSGAAAVETVRGLAPSSKVDDLSRKSKEEIYAASIEGQLSRGESAAALSRLTEKDADGNVEAAKYLGGQKYLSLLTQAQARREHASQFEVSQAGREFDDNIALIKDGKPARPGFSAKDIATRVAGGNQDKFDAVYKDLSIKTTEAYWTGQGREKLRGKSEAERANILANLAPNPDSGPYKGRIPNDQGIDPETGELITTLGYDNVSQLHKELLAWNAADSAAMKKDPAGYFPGANDEVRDAYVTAGNAAKAVEEAQTSNPAAVPQLKVQAQAAFNSAIESNLLAQKNAGIQDRDQSVLPLQQASSIAAQIMGVSDKNQVEPSFYQLQQQYGKYFEKALTAMTSSKLPENERLSPIYAEIAQNLGSGTNRLLISGLRELDKDPHSFDNVYASSQEEAAAKAALFTPDAKKFLQAVSLNGEGAAAFNNKIKTAEFLSKLQYRATGSKSADGSARSAASTFFTEPYHYIENNGNVLIVPKTDREGRPIAGFGFIHNYTPFGGDRPGGTLYDIEYNLQAKKDYYGEQPASYFDPSHFAAAPANMSQAQKETWFQYQLQTKAFWHATGDKRGAQLWMQLGGPGTAFAVQLRDGRPIYHDYDQVAWELPVTNPSNQTPAP